MPKPTAAHAKLEKLIGTWSGDEVMSPSPWDGGGPAKGSVNNRGTVDGFAVVQEYEQRRGGDVSFRGHGVFSYDAQAGQYLLHWWDSMGMGMQEFRGNFIDDVLAMTCKSPIGNTRCSFDVSKPGQYAFKMEMSQDGQNWMTAMTGEYGKGRTVRTGGGKSAKRKPAKKMAAKSSARGKKKPASAKARKKK